MEQPFKKNTRKITAIAFFLLAFSLNAAPGMAILPFRVAGQVDPLYFSSSSLPESLQEAAHFLAQSSIEYPLLDLMATEAALASRKHSSSAPFTAAIGQALCIETATSYLLVSSLSFSSGQKVIVNTIAFNCRSNTVIARSRQTGIVSELQQLLQQALKESTPFATHRKFFAPEMKAGIVEAGIVLDTSGSMSTVLPDIQSFARSMGNYLPAGSRMATWILEDRAGERIDRIGFTSNTAQIIRLIETRQATGEIKINTLVAALNQVASEKFFGQNRRLFIFSDAVTGNNQMATLEDALRRLKRSNIQIAMYQLASQGHNERQEWNRLARSLQLEDPQLVWGRRLGFLQGYSIFMVQQGNRFYRAARDLQADIEQNRLDLAGLIPVQTESYRKDQLNLMEMPEVYAKSEKLNLSGAGALVSNLEKRAVQFATRGTTKIQSPYKVLVEHEGKAFWIYLNNSRDFKELQLAGNRPLYAGLRFMRTPEGELVNIPDYVYIRSQNQVPQLLINKRSHLMKVPAQLIRPEDVWFLLVRIKDSSGEGKDLLE